MPRPYQLLPFQFERLKSREVFLSNVVGEFVFLPESDFDRLINYQISPKENAFLDLKAKQIVTDTDPAPVIDMLSVKYRTKKSFLDHFTSLHMVVPTLRCNSNCRYCQVSRKDPEASGCDMNKKTAKKIVDLIFCSPSAFIKIEIQGGEALLNFEMVKYIFEYAEWLNIFKKKHLEFVVCTNLTLINRNILKYFKEHHIYVSTSLDGYKDLHNKNRPLQNTDNSYDIFLTNLKLCREHLGNDGVSALMTTSKSSLGHFKEIIDEYMKRGFSTIFLRSLNPFGFAKQSRDDVGYGVDEFLENYIEALDYILEINLNGRYFVELSATLFLRRILTPFSTGFVDLQSPAGTAINGVIYNYDGNVYVSDEARMLASMGDNKFLMGNVHKKSYRELFDSDFLHTLIGTSCVEFLPDCCDCAFQSYCGADPVRNYSEQGDIVGDRTTSEFCKKNKTIISHLLKLIRKNDEHINKVFWAWINRQPELLKVAQKQL